MSSKCSKKNCILNHFKFSGRISLVGNLPGSYVLSFVVWQFQRLHWSCQATNYQADTLNAFVFI